MKKQLITLDMIVAGINSEGDPDFFFCKVTGSQEDYDNDEFYNTARTAAREQGYGPELVAFDQDDGPSFLFNHFEWDTATKILINHKNDVQDSYKNAECPDCQEPIPPSAQDGDECENCGHVFYAIRQQ